MNYELGNYSHSLLYEISPKR